MESEFIVCTHCNLRMLNYQNQHCGRQFLTNRSSITCNIRKSIINKLEDDSIRGNSKINEFIKETQLNSKYCDDFIEWIPHSSLENIKFLTYGGNSKIYFGTWNLASKLS